MSVFLSVKLAAARLWATQRAPYFAVELMSLRPYPLQPGVSDTLSVTRRGVLFWSPEFIDKHSVPGVGSVLIHEIMHLLLHHADRCAEHSFNQKLFNMAGDMEINDGLVAMGLPLPNPLLPKAIGMPDNMLAEEYYAELLKQSPSEPGGGKQCGGCAGNPVDGESEVDEKLGHSDAEMENTHRAAAEEIKRCVAAGQRNIPGELVRWANEKVKPARIPWRDMLARYTRACLGFRPGASMHTFSKISRRQGGLGFGVGKPVVAATVSTLPRVTVAIDTSGSMSAAELDTAVSEAAGVLQASGANVTFIACDAHVHSMQPVRDYREIKKLLKGGGGTDFRPVFEAISNQRLQPEVLVFITDGCGPAPAGPPPFQVIWVLVGPYHQVPAQWGKVVVAREAET